MSIDFIGKRLKFRYKIKNEYIYSIIGTLDSTKNLIYIIENNLGNIKIKKLYIGEIEIKLDNEVSLISLGIKSDFECLIKDYEEIK